MSRLSRQWTTSPQRRVLPLAAAVGSACTPELFSDGEAQYRAIAQLAEKVALDGYFTFMDLSVEAEAFGAPIAFSASGAPAVTTPLIVTAEDVAALKIPQVGAGRTGAVLRCAGFCANRMEQPVFTGMIGPFSLACRLAGMTEALMMTITEPETLHALLEKCGKFLAAYLKAQKECGIAGVLVAEPAAGLISAEMCGEFSSAYLKTLFAPVKDEDFTIILHNCGNTERQVPALLAAGADALHVGNAVRMTEILKQCSALPVLGNLDPVGLFLQQKPEQIETATAALLAECAAYPNFVPSTGCDLPFGVPLENLRAFVAAIAAYNAKI